MSGFIPYCMDCGIENPETTSWSYTAPGDYYPTDGDTNCKACGGAIGEYDPSSDHDEEFDAE